MKFLACHQCYASAAVAITVLLAAVWWHVCVLRL